MVIRLNERSTEFHLQSRAQTDGLHCVIFSLIIHKLISLSPLSYGVILSFEKSSRQHQKEEK